MGVFINFTSCQLDVAFPYIDEKASYPIEPGMSNRDSDSKEALDIDDVDAPERGNWTGKLDFLLSCIGYAVGLGNVWRFPYLCYRNGGGAFLIPYVIMLIFVGIPIFFMELSIGQYGQLGPLTLFKNMTPLFKGLGYAMMIATALVAIYYNMIIAWTFFYLFDSFRTDVQWQYCDHDFNTNNCFSDRDYKSCIGGENGSTFLNRTCFNANVSQLLNLSSIPQDQRVSAPEEYLKYVHFINSSNWGVLGWRNEATHFYNISEISDAEYDYSVRVTAQLRDAIYDQCSGEYFENDDELYEAKKSITKDRLAFFKQKRDRLITQLNEHGKLMLDLASEKGASSWLTALPLKSFGYVLNQQEFADALALRYNFQIKDVAKVCVCGEVNSVNHCLICKKGGYVSLRHNWVRDTISKLLVNVKCKDVQIEPHLLSTRGYQLPSGSVTADQARLDISARSVWNMLGRAFFDVRVFHAPAPSNMNKSIPQIKYMLAKSSGLGEIGEIRWQLACCLLLAWMVIFFCLIKGIKSSGRVVYFTATFPYIVLFILFIRGVTLEGAYEGIKFYMVPKWDKLSDIGVWNDAAVQIFYSLSVAGGGLITLSSYNKFNNNVLRDTLIVCFANCLTSVFAGFVIFSVLGFMSVQLGVAVEDVVKDGPGLAFIAYPDAISRMPISPLWAILFFLMLFTLGLDSQFAIVENLLTAVMDEVPKSRKYKSLVVFIICVLGMILGLPLTTNGGIYVLDLMDNYAAGWPYLFCGMVECILIGHFYGIGNFFEDVKQMIGWSPSMVTKSHLTVLFVTISPTLIGIILILSWAQYTPLKSGDYTFEPWGNGIGFIMSFVPILLIPGIAIYQLIWTHKDLSLKDRFKLLTTPTDVWRKAAKAHGVGSMHTSNGTDVIRTPQFQRPYAAYDNPVAYESPPEYETHM
ncbi:Sodium- and chloride-dependent glycine transporter 1 [Nymphon striatum]|nr:Sodium- and chloride-dependent glycine transporter 1 [Nymphon striatum]